MSVPGWQPWANTWVAIRQKSHMLQPPPPVVVVELKPSQSHVPEIVDQGGTKLCSKHLDYFPQIWSTKTYFLFNCAWSSHHQWGDTVVTRKTFRQKVLSLMFSPGYPALEHLCMSTLNIETHGTSKKRKKPEPKMMCPVTKCQRGISSAVLVRSGKKASGVRFSGCKKSGFI
jgi:hypothetical protein